MQCSKCGKGTMVETVQRKWSPRLLYLLIGTFIAILFFWAYGVLSARWGEENVMPIFIGLTPLVVVPFAIELRRRKLMHGWKCTNCDNFIEKTD